LIQDPRREIDTQGTRIVPIDMRQAPEEVVEGMGRHLLAIKQERNPEYPLLPLEEMVKELRHPPEKTLKIGHWAIYDKECTAARAWAMLNLVETEIPSMLADISVLPSYRRRGLATRLLDPLKEFAGQHGKTTLIIESTDRLPGGKGFLDRIGAEPGMAGHVNRLNLRNLDKPRMKRWVEQARRRVHGCRLMFFEGVPPENLMVSYCDMVTHINETQPSGTIQFPFKVATAEWVRERFKSEEDAGRRFWSLVAIEEATERIAGYTEMFFHPKLPQLVIQGGTCVLIEFRNRGIGHWLKASLILKLAEENPEANWILTGNADVNAPMLKINYEMGFQPCEETTFWQYRIP
jgi:GNAT superfamily N-acetyltransferase